jgi:DNA-binding CsgD family transcriptional regulator/N-acetylneuraminic acid mutarotase
MSNDTGLSDREREILCLVATGASNKQIAQQLFISANTVKVHMRNIFAKIGVTSRTEATLYAMREGLVAAPLGPLPFPSPDENEPDEGAAEELAIPPLTIPVSEPAWRKWLLPGLFALIIMGLSVGLLFALRNPAQTAVPTPQVQPTPVRWQQKAPMPSARSGLAAAVYDDQIYAIGGEGVNGVTGEVDVYSPQEDKWKVLTSMPTPVADIGAVVIGGKIYVPGGRVADGNLSSQLQVFNSDINRWVDKASLPIPLAGYGLITLDGKLYLFGGWNGSKVVGSVYVYDPDADKWVNKTEMPTPRAYMGVAVVGGKIFVTGGKDDRHALTANEAYSPEKDQSGNSPWEQRKPLPQARAMIGMVGLVDAFYVVGGESASSGSSQALIYQPQMDDWQTISQPIEQVGAFPGIVTYQNYLYIFGGKQAGIWSNTSQIYQAIYTISIPIVR